MSEIKRKTREFVVDNFLFGDDNGLQESTSFLQEGIIDSTGILELVNFIEEEFHIQVQDDELLPENLDSLEKVTHFLEKKTIKVA